MKYRILTNMIKISAIIICLLTTNMVWGQKPDLNIVVNTDLGEMQSLSLANSENNISNGDLLKGYIQQRFDDILPMPMGKRASSRSARVGLSGIDQKAYDYLKSQIQQVASGAISSTIFSIPLTELTSDVGPWTAEELGVTYIYDSTKEQPWNSEALNAVSNKVSFDLHKVFEALLADCPYELYWYDKVSGCTYSPYDSFSYNGQQLSIQGNTTITMKVAQEYAVQGDGVYYPTQFNTEKVDAVNFAIANAQGIVNSSTGSTLQKLITYKEQICELTSYNSFAAESSSYPYGDPWQLVWVFDGDESTKVVCEGYSKAFKYLCDLSGFQDVECLIATGTMNGGTGAGPHMWNVMKMDDGRNYLIDVTNCDAGTIGAPNLLFMAYGPSGNYDQDYTFSVGNYNITYTYDSDTKNTFGEHDLTISESQYTAIGDVDGDGVIDLADAVLVINHYVGKPVAKFNEKAADVDGDNVIDLADAVRIINYYVGKVQSLARSIDIDGLDPQ